jgi:hypothetical protein
LDRTVRLPTLSSLTLQQWLDEYQRLKKLNAEIMRIKKKPAVTPQTKLSSAITDLLFQFAYPDYQRLNRLLQESNLCNIPSRIGTGFQIVDVVT